jgi:hypothetical protein
LVDDNDQQAVTSGHDGSRQKLADEAFADLLRKRDIPDDQKAALLKAPCFPIPTNKSERSNLAENQIRAAARYLNAMRFG